MFNTKLKASASETLVEFDLLLQGFEVFRPTAYGGEYDLIAVKDGVLYKIQVKSGTRDGNKLKCDVRKSSRAKDRYYSANGYDLLAVTDIDTRLVAYVKREEMSAKASINFWLEEPPTRSGLAKEYTVYLFSNFTTCPTK